MYEYPYDPSPLYLYTTGILPLIIIQSSCLNNQTSTFDAVRHLSLVQHWQVNPGSFMFSNLVRGDKSPSRFLSSSLMVAGFLRWFSPFFHALHMCILFSIQYILPLMGILVMFEVW